jgi:aspartyl/asparaginyl beta-hydroxylase (cupin superfamily)
MLSKNITVIFFILIILIFIFCTFFMSRIGNSESFITTVDENNIELSTIEKNTKYNDKLVDSFAKNQIKFNTLKKPNNTISKYQTFYDISIYPELTNIDYSVVKDELIDYMNIANNNWMDWPEYDLWKSKNPSSSWKIIPLMSFNKWSDKNTKLFPKTTEQLKNIKGLVSAGFSKLGPDTTLALHKGWGNLSNNVLRCHLGLVVPKSKCKVFVMGKTNDLMYQQEGKWIVFDDSLYHSASNESDSKDRIILLLDIERPSHIEKGNSDVVNSPELNNFIDEFNKNL